MKKLKKGLFLLLFLYSNYGMAQSEMVDLFTGDFKYNVPAMVVPSPDGPGVSISLNYRGPIQMHQKASWVGLGWDMSVGEIRRNLKGVPDEWNGKPFITKKYRKEVDGSFTLAPEDIDETTYYGPLHFKDFVNGLNHAMDTYSSASKGGKSTTFPDYDQFVVTGPGISGIMQPFLFDKGSLVHKDRDGSIIDSPDDEVSLDADITTISLDEENHPFMHGSSTLTNATCKSFNNNAQFRFINEFSNVDVPHPYNDLRNRLNFNKKFETDETYSGLQTNGEVANARHINYYTNAEIIAGTELNDFIDCSHCSDFTRPNNTDIGGFSVTNEAGMTFHYALPVYMNAEKNITLEMDDFNPANIQSVTTSSKSSYVSSWKLTAITGPDFRDNGTTGRIDTEDEGYWAMFSYGLWKTDFPWQGPYYGGNRNFGENAEHYEQIFHRYTEMGSFEHGVYQDLESITQGELQMYYLDYIKTSTHTAAFIKDVRLDEHSKTATGNPIAALRLNRILLMRNEDFGLFNNSATLSATGLNMGNINNIIHIGDYNDNQTTIDQKTIASVVFEHDYSLCKNYYGNIESNITINNNDIYSLPEDFTYEKVSSTGTAFPNSGKLTLKKIKTYGFEAVNETPSYIFGYANNSPEHYTHNPDFHPYAKDYWGYYKSDYDVSINQSIYTSATSKEAVEAWTLDRIETPLGAIIDIEYESDEYSRVGYDGKIYRVFKGDASPNASNSEHWDMNIEDNAFFDYLDNHEANQVQKVSFSFPITCLFYDYFYSGDVQFPSVYLSDHFISSRVTNFDANEIDTEIDDTGNTVSDLTLPFNCGFDDDGSAGEISSIFPQKAIASIELGTVYGGGTRVKSISTTRTDPSAESTSYTTNYYYEEGIASQEPERFTPAYFQGRSKNSLLYSRHEFPPAVGYSKVTVKGLGDNAIENDRYSIHEFINYNSFIVSGGSTVVSGKEKQKLITNYNDYFEAVDNGNSPPSISQVFSVEAIKQSRNMTAFDRNRINIGKIKKQAVFDKNNKLISSTENVYEMISSTAEVFHQRSHAEVPITYDGAYLVTNTNTEQWEEGPWGPFNSPFATSQITILNSNAFFTKRYENQVLKKQIIHKNDMTYITEFLEFDPYTGYPKVIKRTDPSTGDVIRVERIYAYEEYPEMGLKSIDENNENMLGAVYLEKVFKNGVLVDGYRQTYSDIMSIRGYENNEIVHYQRNIWHNKSNFIFNGKSNPEDWKHVITNMLYSPRKHILSRKGRPHDVQTPNIFTVRNRYQSVKYGYNNQFIIAELPDGNFNEFTFSSAENNNHPSLLEGEVLKGDGVINTDLTYVHTGKQSLALNQGVGFRYNSHGTKLSFKLDFHGGNHTYRDFQAKVWVYSPSGYSDIKLEYIIRERGSNFEDLDVLNGTNNPPIIDRGSVNISSTNTITIGQWHLLTLPIKLSDYDFSDLYMSNFDIFCSNSSTNIAYFDDFRFEPLNSPITAYVYDEQKGTLEWILGPENFYDRIEYNAVGQRYRTYRETLEGEKLVTETTRNYRRGLE